MGKAKATAGDDVVKPKRAMSSYFMFMNDRRTKFREDNPEMSMCQITKALTEVWHKLTEDEKKKYSDLAAADKQRYEKEMEALGTTGGGSTSKAAKKAAKDASGAPKKPLTVYFIYLAQVRGKVKEENPELSMCQQTKLISERWRNLTEEEKQTYIDIQDKDKERYARQMAEYEETGKFTPVSNADKSTDEGEK